MPRLTHSCLPRPDCCCCSTRLARARNRPRNAAPGRGGGGRQEPLGAEQLQGAAGAAGPVRGVSRAAPLCHNTAAWLSACSALCRHRRECVRHVLVAWACRHCHSSQGGVCGGHARHAQGGLARLTRVGCRLVACAVLQVERSFSSGQGAVVGITDWCAGRACMMQGCPPCAFATHARQALLVVSRTLLRGGCMLLAPCSRRLLSCCAHCRATHRSPGCCAGCAASRRPPAPSACCWR